MLTTDEARLMLHRGTHALGAAAAQTNAKDFALGKSKFGHVNLCLKRVLHGGRGDEVTVQAGRKRGVIKTATVQHAAAQSCAQISSAPLDHELAQSSGDFMYSTHLHAGAPSAQLTPLLLPGDVQAQAIEAVRDAPVEDALQHTQWERAKHSLQRQEELQQAVGQALPAMAAAPLPLRSPHLQSCVEPLAALWPAPAVREEAVDARQPHTPAVVPPDAAKAVCASGGSAQQGTATTDSPSTGSSAAPTAHVVLKEKVNVGLVGAQVKLAAAAVQAQHTQSSGDALVTVQASGDISPQSSQLRPGDSCELKGSVAGASSPLVAVTSKCDVVLQLGAWLASGKLVSVKASSSVKLASNRHDVLWHLPMDKHCLGQEVELKAKCTASEPLAAALQGRVVDTPWRARVRSGEYDAGGQDGTHAAHIRIESGAQQPVDAVATTELVVVAKPAAGP